MLTKQWVWSVRQNFCEASISLPSSNICDYQLYLQSKPITNLRDLVKSSCAMACEVESEVESLLLQTLRSEDTTSTRIFGKVSYLYIGEVLQRHRARDAHNHRDPLAFWVRQRSKNVHTFEALEQRHRINKLQAQNCDTCSELK